MTDLNLTANIEWCLWGEQDSGAILALTTPSSDEAPHRLALKWYNAAPAWRGRVWLSSRPVGEWTIVVERGAPA